MKKNIIVLALLLSSGFAFSQVGVNTVNPKATLDIEAKSETGTTTSVDGLLMPRVDRQRAQSMTGVENSTLLYINDITTGAQTGTAANIDAVGYYYYETLNDVWIKLNNSDAPSSSVITIGSGVTRVNASGLSDGVYKIVVSSGTLCGNNTIMEFLISSYSGIDNVSIAGINGLSNQGSKLPTISEPDRTTTVVTWNGIPSCADGSDATNLDYTMAIPMNGIVILTNNGNVIKDYKITVTKIN